MSAVPENHRLLSAATYALIDRECAKFPAQQRQSAVIPALAHAQRQLGWLSDEVMREVADYLRMAPIAVYEVATFYNMFDLAQPGRFKIAMCTNLPCALSGANQAAAHLKRRLGIDFGETTADGCFTLKEGECMGACGDAPVLIVNNERMESFMSDEKLDSLIDELRGKERS